MDIPAQQSTLLLCVPQLTLAVANTTTAMGLALHFTESTINTGFSTRSYYGGQKGKLDQAQYPIVPMGLGPNAHICPQQQASASTNSNYPSSGPITWPTTQATTTMCPPQVANSSYPWTSTTEHS